MAAEQKKQGLRPGDRVLLAGDASAFWVECYLGIALAGGVSVPVAVPAEAKFLTAVLASTEPRAACVQSQWLRRLAPYLVGCGPFEEFLRQDASTPFVSTTEKACEECEKVRRSG